MRKLLIAGNWKMNLDIQSSILLAEALASSIHKQDNRTIAVFPPSVFVNTVADILKTTSIQWGLQNIHFEEKGAFTGEVSSLMAKNLQCDYTLVGHSERRTLFGETDELIYKKVMSLLKNQIIPIVCIGETLTERDSEKTFEILEKQLHMVFGKMENFDDMNFVVAYEPVWAIGSGLTATPQQAQDVHHFIRNRLRYYNIDLAEKTQIIYGGSVNSKNAAMLISKPDIDGVLVGGASLISEEFLTICNVES